MKNAFFASYPHTLLCEFLRKNVIMEGKENALHCRSGPSHGGRSGIIFPESLGFQ